MIAPGFCNGPFLQSVRCVPVFLCIRPVVLRWRLRSETLQSIGRTLRPIGQAASETPLWLRWLSNRLNTCLRFRSPTEFVASCQTTKPIRSRHRWNSSPQSISSGPIFEGPKVVVVHANHGAIARRGDLLIGRPPTRSLFFSGQHR